MSTKPGDLVYPCFNADKFGPASRAIRPWRVAYPLGTVLMCHHPNAKQTMPVRSWIRASNVSR